MARGRPKKQIDPKLLEDLAGIGCTNEEIAHVAGCSSDTLTRNYAEHIKSGRENAKVSLRRKQWAVAMNGSTGMLIWLGKQMLGQGERVLPPEGKPLDFGTLPTPTGDFRTTGKPN